MERRQRNTLIVLCAVLAAALALILSPFQSPLASWPLSGDSGNSRITNPSVDQRTMRIVAAGNWDCTNDTARTVQGIKSRNPDIILGLGDYSYNSTADCWMAEAKPLGFDKIKLAIGEVDREPVALREQYLTGLQLPGEYYSFNAGNAHFLALSTEVPEQTIGTPEYKFAEKDLASASADPEIKWIIVYFNRPMYTAQPLAAFSTFRETYHPLFEKYGVDVVLQGRAGNYQRTFPLYFNEKAPQTPLLEAATAQGNDTSAISHSNSSSYVNPTGIIFLTAGTAGHEPINLLPSKSNFVEFQYDLAHGFLELDISPSNDGAASANESGASSTGAIGSSTLTGQFYANSQDSIDDRPLAVDSFSVTKS